MATLQPASAEELAALLGEASAAGHTVTLSGNNSKHRAGGPISPADVSITTKSLDGVLQYEPKDLTVSVGAGMPYARFRDMLAKDGYMVPLDPPFGESATLGGILAANSSGPRRRAFGTGRDLVIGLRFATMEGKLVQSGGMVVKNVAGLDMAKLLIGSLGTLAVIASVNFKLIPLPAGSRTFLFEFASADEAMRLRDRLIQEVLHPIAVDVLNPAASALIGRSKWLLAVGTQGNEAVLARYDRELGGGEKIEGEAEAAFWRAVQEVTPKFLAANPQSAVVRCAVPLKALGDALQTLGGAVIARAANGVCYAHFDSAQQALPALRTGKAVMEYGPEQRENLEMWPVPEDTFPIMQRIKEMFDPKNLLNRGRLYGRL